MTSLTDLDLAPARVMLVGYPGAGKTGSLACLANEGWKLRVLDFDGNLRPLIAYTTPEGKANIDVLTFEDKLRAGPQFVDVSGVPDAYANAWKALDRWISVGPDGEETDLGRSRDWGPDTIVVLDGISGMGRAAKRRAMRMLNKTPLNFTQQGWGLGMGEQEQMLEAFTAMRNRFHIIVLSHLVMIGPEKPQKGDDETTLSIKEAAADLVPTRLYPKALGRQLPQSVAEHFETTLQVKAKTTGHKVSRVILTQPTPELDLKCPIPNIQGELPIKDGMLTIFNGLTGGIKNCREATAEMEREREKEE